MAKFYRGDTLPVTASYDGYKFNRGDRVTCKIFQQVEEGEEYGEPLASVELEVQGEADAVQLEFSREQMHNVDGEVMVEVRTITTSDTEMTIQKALDLRKDAIR